MNIVYFGNNWLGLKVLEWLIRDGNQISALVLHPMSTRRYGEQMLECLKNKAVLILDGSELSERKNVEALSSVRADIGISVMFGYILRRDIFELFPKHCFNLHTSYLPYNRGSYPNVWSIVDQTPAGVSLHKIDEGVDTGAIIAREMIEVLPVDTGKTLHERLTIAALELFQRSWKEIKNGYAVELDQKTSEGSSHKISDVDRIDFIDLEKLYKGKDLINILRARSFPPYKGAYFIYEGRKIYINLSLYYDKTEEEEKCL